MACQSEGSLFFSSPSNTVVFRVGMGAPGLKFGYVLLGGLLSFYFFGISSYQTLTYLQSYRDDPYQQRCFVVLIWTLELANGILAGRLLYSVLLTNFMDFGTAISKSYILLSQTGFLSVLITALIQWYFAFRLYKLSASKIIPLISAIFSLMRWICYIGGGTYRQVHHTQSRGWTLGLFAVGVLSIITDVLMAGNLCVCLWKRRGEEEEFTKLSFGFPRTIDSIIVISIQANAFTCVVTTITVILYKTSNNLAWMGMSLVASRLFSISFLSSLLSGKKLSPQAATTAPPTILLNNSTIAFPTVGSFTDTEPTCRINPSRVSISSHLPDSHGEAVSAIRRTSDCDIV